MCVPARHTRLVVISAHHSTNHCALPPLAELRAHIGRQISPLKAPLANRRLGGRSLSGGRDARAYSGGIERPRAHTA